MVVRDCILLVTLRQSQALQFFRNSKPGFTFGSSFGVERGALGLESGVGEVIVQGDVTAVDYAKRREFDNAVGHGLDELVVMRGKKDSAAESFQTFIE